MTRNVGTADRAVRAAIAALIAVLVGMGTVSGGAAVLLGIVGLVMLVTALAGSCPLYSLAGLSTVRRVTSPGAR